MSDDAHIIMHKKMKTNPTPLSNTFAPLMVLEDTSENVPGEQKRGKENKPPSIHLHKVTNVNQFITDIKNLTADNFKHATTNGKVKLNCETTEGYRKIVLYLQANKAEFYTFQLSSEIIQRSNPGYPS